MSKKNENWKIIFKFFLLFLGGIIFAAFLFKGVAIAKNSIYDGKNRFTLVLANKSSNQNFSIFSINPANHSLAFINIETDTDFGKKRQLQKNAQDFIGGPIDGWIVLNSELRIANSESLKNALSIGNMIGQARNGDFRDLDTNLTILDLWRVWLDTTSINVDKIEAVNVSPSEDTAMLDRITSTLLYDGEVIGEKKTIEVINATEKAGLGAKVARIITNMGNPVLFIKSGDSKQAKSVIYIDKASYTAQKLSKILGIPISKNQNKDINVDIRIVVGEDY